MECGSPLPLWMGATLTKSADESCLANRFGIPLGEGQGGFRALSCRESVISIPGEQRREAFHAAPAGERLFRHNLIACLFP